MLDSLRDQLYPCLLVTKIEVSKVAVIPNPSEHEKKLISFLERVTDIDSRSLWEYARNIIWTYNTFAFKCILNEKPTEALKLFRATLKIIDNKHPRLDWTTRDEWKILKISILRNLAYFYCKYMDFKLAVAKLNEIEKLQAELDPELRDKIDTDSPTLVLAYLYLVLEDLPKAENCAEMLLSARRDPGNVKKAEFMESTLLQKKDQVYKIISNFIIGKCYLHKQMYEEALEKYKQGIFHLQSCDVFNQNFKDAIRVDYTFIKKKLGHQSMHFMQPMRPSSSDKNKPKPENPKNYPEIKFNPVGFQRELRIKTPKSESTRLFHSPPPQFSFGDIRTTPQPSLTKLSSHKRESTARFENDKFESIASVKEKDFDEFDLNDNVKVASLPETKQKVSSPPKQLGLNLKLNNFIDKINPRPQSGTTAKIPTLSGVSDGQFSATSRLSHHSSKKSIDGKIVGMIENEKIYQIRELNKHKIFGPPEKIKEKEKTEKGLPKVDFSKLNLSDVEAGLAELVDMDSEHYNKQSSRTGGENFDTPALSDIKVDSYEASMDSLASLLGDGKPDDKEDRLKIVPDAKEFSMNVFKSMSNKTKEVDLNKRTSNLLKKAETIEEQPPNLKHLIYIRDVEKNCAIKIQRWWRRKRRPRPPRLTKYGLINGYNQVQSPEASKSGRLKKTQQISQDTITQSEDVFTSKDSQLPPTLANLQVPRSGGFTPKKKANSALGASDSPKNGSQESFGKIQSRANLPPSSLADKTNNESLKKLISQTNFSSLTPIELSMLDFKRPRRSEIKSAATKFDDKKGGSESVSEASTVKSRTKRNRKSRPGFKESLNNEEDFNKPNYIKSRSSLQRSKTSTEKSFRYEPKKFPEEMNEGIKFKIMRRFTALKELKNVSLRFYKAFMSKSEIWFLRYITNSWGMRNKDQKELILHLELANTSGRSIELRIPLFCGEDPNPDKFITVWPIIYPCIQNWFKDQKFEEEFEKYEVSKANKIPKRMYRRVEKAMTLYGLRGPSKLGSEDKRNFYEIQKRLTFLIDKKLIPISKPNGKSFLLVQSSLGEKAKILHKKIADKEKNQRDIVRALCIEIQTDKKFSEPDDLNFASEIFEFEKECFEEMTKIKKLKGNKKTQDEEVKKVKFRVDFGFEREEIPSKTIFSRKIIFQGILRMKEFHWVYIIHRISNNNLKNSKSKAPENIIDIVVEKSNRRNKRSSQNRREIFKFFTFSQDEFLRKCADFFQMSSLRTQSLKRMSYPLKAEIARRLHEIIIDQGDAIRLGSLFQKEETEDDPFAKAVSFYRVNEKNTFQEFNFEKSVVAATDNDYLFDKNFKEVYGKFFINHAQKYFSNKSYGDDGVLDSNMVEDSSNNFMFKQHYIDDDEGIITSNTKTGDESLESSFVAKKQSLGKCRYYFEYKYQGTLCYIRLKCNTDLSGQKYINISYYHPNREQINYTNIADQKLLTKIKSILDLSSPVLQLRLLKGLILYGVSSIGRVLDLKSTSYDVNLIQRKYAIPVNPSYLKIDMLNQTNNLESAFETWTLYFIHKFEESLGKCYVKLNVYRKKVLIMTDKITPDMNVYYFSFEINPEKSKTRQYRLLLNSYDLKSYLNIRIESDSSYYFMKLSRSVLDKFIIWKKFTAKILALPVSRTVQELPDSPNLHVFYNTFSVNTFETKMKINNALEPKNYAPKIIYQGVRKYNKNFYMITVEYVHRFDYWNIHVYNPKTSRNFVCVVFFEEILNWKNSFLKKIYPSFMNDLKKYHPKHFKEFVANYLKHLKKAKKKDELRFTSVVEIPSSKRVMFTPMTRSEIETLDKKEKRLFFKIDKLYSLPFLRRKKDPLKSITSRHNIDREDPINQMDFFEFKFWESVVNNMVFSTDKHGRDTIKIDNFEGYLSELIFTSVLQIDKSADCLIEIHIENSHEKKFLNLPFENITYLSSINNILYIKIFFFNLVICQREKLYLREIINLYIADGLYKYQANYIDSKMNLADLQNICGYIIHKIRSSNLLTLLNESPLFSKRFSLQQKSEYRIKIKTNAPTEPDDNIDEKKGVFMYRKIISTKPFISASVYFDKYRENFMIYLYRFSDCALVVKEYKIKEVKKKISSFKNYIEAGLYGLVGKLIIESNENFLKIYAAYTYNILEMSKNK